MTDVKQTIEVKKVTSPLRSNGAMEFVINKSKRNSTGDIKANITLLAADGSPLYEDSINLTKRSSRDRFANAVCEKFPQLKGKDIESQLSQLLWKEKTEEPKPSEDQIKKSQAEKLVKLAVDKEVTFFHTPAKAAYARLSVEGHFEIYNTRSKAFKQWWSKELYSSEGIAPNSDSLNSAINIIEGKAIYEGETHDLNNRVADYKKKFYYDLTDTAWRAVEISETGWEIIEQPPIIFQRYQHQKQQIEPVHNGDISKVLNFVNLEKGNEPEDNQQLLFLVYLVASFVPDIPHPIIHPYGHHGAAKSTFMRVIKRLADPSIEELLICPKDVNDLAQKLSHHWVCFFDNLTTIPDWLSDMLCRVATGAAFAKRELFTDDSDIIFQLKRIAGMNGINIVATKADLLDRTIPLELMDIPEDKRRMEKDFWLEFNDDVPQILGGIFDTLSKAKAIYPTLKLERLPRMADFAQWGAAISEALGYPSGDFLKAYQENIKSQNSELLNSNPISQTILELLKDKDYWNGTATNLLADLESMAEKLKIKTNDKYWPKSPEVLSKKLNEIVPNLRKDSIEVKNIRRSGVRFIKINKILQQPLPITSENAVITVPPYNSASNNGDGEGDGSEVEEHGAVTKTANIEKNCAVPSCTVTDTVMPKQPQNVQHDGNDGVSETFWKRGDDKNNILDTVIPSDLLEMWVTKGRPLIYLSPGESCEDLEKRITFKFDEIQFKSLMEWYNNNKTQEIEY